MPTINLDTHMLVHALAGDLKPAERSLLSGATWGIAAIVLWELVKLSQLGKIDFDFDDPETQAALSGVHVWPMDVSVARISTELDFRGDPADELIAATSIVHRVPLLTRDRRIRRSKMVPLAG